MTLIQTFHGTASNGTPLTAVYAEQPAAAAAFALVFPGSDLPRFVHWGRPLTAPETVINTFDALAPQRVSGALDYTAWPSVLPTQSEAWSGSDRFDAVSYTHLDVYKRQSLNSSILTEWSSPR